MTGVAFGLAPALRAIGTDVAAVIGGIGTARRRVARQVQGWSGSRCALSLVLLVGTGLVVRSMMQMERVDIGFRRDGLTVVTTNAAQAGYQPLDGRRVVSGH